MNAEQLAHVLALLRLTTERRQLAALGRFLVEAFGDDPGTAVVVRAVERRTWGNSAPE